MATEQITVEQQVDKGLKSGALGLVSTTIIATASVAPAYSIAATLVFVVGFVGLSRPPWPSSRSCPCCSARSATAS